MVRRGYPRRLYCVSDQLDCLIKNGLQVKPLSIFFVFSKKLHLEGGSSCEKRAVLLAASTCVIVISIAAFGLAGRRPFWNLQASDVISATVHLSPPDKTIPIPEIPELVSYLREVVVYSKDDSYSSYCGQGVTFTLTMSGGGQVRVMVYNPFAVIDGVGYRTKYAPCEKLNHYANELPSAAGN